MKKAIVLGATGGMGYALVNELVEREVHVTAFARNQKKLQSLFGTNSDVQLCPGDAFSQTELNNAVKENDVIFHAINLPYADWQGKLPILTKNIIAAAKIHGAKLAIVDNIYSYGRSPGDKVTESAPKNPHTKKGRIRLEMEQLYEETDVPYVLAHFPDFYGPYAENTMIHFTLKKMIKNQKAQFVGDQTLSREYIFTPDGAKALVELAFHEKSYGQNWNIPGYDVISGQELIAIMRGLTNNNKKVSTITKNMLRFVGLFNMQMREFVEMQYLNEVPVVLNGEKYKNKIGPVPKTAYEEGIARTIKSME